MTISFRTDHKGRPVTKPHEFFGVTEAAWRQAEELATKMYAACPNELDVGVITCALGGLLANFMFDITVNMASQPHKINIPVEDLAEHVQRDVLLVATAMFNTMWTGYQDDRELASSSKN